MDICQEKLCLYNTRDFGKYLFMRGISMPIKLIETGELFIRD